MKTLKNMGLGLSVLVFALLVGVKPALAAPYSNVNVLPERTTDKSFTVRYDYLGSGGSPVVKVQLFVSKDSGPYVERGITTDPNIPFEFDTTYLGVGQYDFYTIATTQNGEVESKISRAEASVIVDYINPAAPKTDKIYLDQATTPDFDTVQGLIDSVESFARVEVYSDAGLKNLIASANATDTGVWGPIQIGDNTNPAIWIVAIDANGNRSEAARMENMIDYDRAVSALHLTAYAGDHLNLDYAGPGDGRQFAIDYKHSGGSEWTAHLETTSTTPVLSNLEPGRAYDIRVAPVDQYGNVGVYSFATLRTQGTPVGPIVAVGGSAVTPKVGQPVTGTTTPTATAETAAPTTTDTTTDQTTASQPTEDQGEQPAVAGESTEVQPADQAAPTEEQPAVEDQSTSKATPWVILAVLIILAAIATGGYFYWFSGPEEVTTTVKPDEEKEDKDKRW